MVVAKPHSLPVVHWCCVENIFPVGVKFWRNEQRIHRCWERKFNSTVQTQSVPEGYCCSTNDQFLPLVMSNATFGFAVPRSQRTAHVMRVSVANNGKDCHSASVRYTVRTRVLATRVLRDTVRLCCRDYVLRVRRTSFQQLLTTHQLPIAACPLHKLRRQLTVRTGDRPTARAKLVYCVNWRLFVFLLFWALLMHFKTQLYNFQKKVFFQVK